MRSPLHAIAFALAVTGCRTTDPPVAAADAGSPATPLESRPAPPEPEPATPRSCREQCQDAHPTARAKDDAIEACWMAQCRGPCIELLPEPHDGGAPDANACASPVVTVSESCDRCTLASCCAAWDGCFQDPACAALNACYEQCSD